MAVPPSPQRWTRMTQKQRDRAIFWSSVHMMLVPIAALIVIVALIIQAWT